MQKKKVLIVDDEIELSEVILYRLEALGYDVQLAENGRVGVDKAIQYSPDLILLDALMPVMNGYEASLQLKEDKRTQNIPVILFTAALDTSIGRKCLKYSDDLLVKPYDTQELVQKIEQLVN
ncbi:MAG: hypothetical protein ACD_62C00387G0002 [uncultured bacterium]|nr:MAG: hypothetical protein ACD_62C00387G0002 [uncultured bacterium]HLD44016.1 response regulator [bacterium]